MDTKKLQRLRRRAFERQAGLCYWCARPMLVRTKENAAETWNHPRVCTADHVMRVADGGPTDAGNVVAACRECNNGRHNGREWVPHGPDPRAGRATLADVWPRHAPGAPRASV